MKVLVTGGAGYLGSILVPQLLDKGHHVTVFDKLNWGIHSLLSVTNNKSLTIIKGDIMDREHVEQVVAGADAIIHLAAIVGFPACDSEPVVAEETNVNGTRNIIESKSASQIFVYASTESCYGEIDGICTEELKLNPLTRYGITKAKGEEIVLAAGGISLRLNSLFGVSPRLRLDQLVNKITYEAVVNKKITIFQGSYRRSVLHVRDAARAFVLALENSKQMSGQAYNVGDVSMNKSKIDIAHLVQRIVPDCSVIEDGSGADNDKRDWETAYKKIKQFGYKREITFEDGIKEIAQILPCLQTGAIIQYSNV